MTSFLTIIVPFGVVILLLALALRYLLRSWLDYRVRIAVLETMERRPELLGESADGGSDTLSGQVSSRDGRTDYMITGISLGVIGISCVLVGWNMRVGQLAVGVYLGGIFCLCLGFVLGLVGFFVRRMRRPVSLER
jgi:hypothetical protein